MTKHRAKKPRKTAFKKCVIANLRRTKITTRKGLRRAVNKAVKKCRKLAPKARRHKRRGFNRPLYTPFSKW